MAAVTSSIAENVIAAEMNGITPSTATLGTDVASRSIRYAGVGGPLAVVVRQGQALGVAEQLGPEEQREALRRVRPEKGRAQRAQLADELDGDEQRHREDQQAVLRRGHGFGQHAVEPSRRAAGRR